MVTRSSCSKLPHCIPHEPFQVIAAVIHVLHAHRTCDPCMSHDALRRNAGSIINTAKSSSNQCVIWPNTRSA